MRIALTYNEKRSRAEAEAEFDTAETIADLCDRLARLGHVVAPVDVGGSVGRLIDRLNRIGPDVIFDIAEGERGAFREAFYPALFEQLGYAYTGSAPSTRALCLDKWLAERIVASVGVAIPGGVIIREISELVPDALGAPPWIVKPNFEGSSKGITATSIVHRVSALDEVARACLASYPDGVLVEQFIDGLDVSIGWIDGLGWLPPMAYRFAAPLYEYALKHETPECVRVEIPAALDDDTHTRLLRAARRAFAALGVTGIGRADFRVTPAGDIVFLELNPLPSLADKELFAAAAAMGRSPEDVLAAIVRSARASGLRAA